MKIAQISATFPPYKGGTGSVCHSYSVELAKLGHDVTVFTSLNNNEKNLKISGFEIKRLKPLLRLGNAPFIPQLLFLIKGFDVVHLHYPFFFGSELVFLLYLFRRQKYFITYHNDVILEGRISFILKIYKKLIMGLILKNATKICVTSLDYAKHSEIKNIVEKEKIIEISNGVDLSNFIVNSSSNKLKRAYGYKTNLLLFVGGMDKAHYFKGVDYLLKSFKRVQEKNRNVKLILIGDGELKDDYIKLSKKLEIDENVEFLGSVSQSELIDYYKMAEIVILPSVTMGEAFGLVLVEAMALSKPVIASNLPGVRSVVDDCSNGILVEPRNIEDLSSKIEFLLERNDLRIKMGLKGREKAENKYNWPIIVKRLEEAYRCL